PWRDVDSASERSLMGGAIIAAVSFHGRLAHAALAMMTCCALLIFALAAPRAAGPPASVDDLLSDLVGRIAGAVAPADRVHLVLAGDPTTEPSSAHRFEADIVQRLGARGIRVAELAGGVPVVRVACSKNLRERVCA